MRRLIAALCLLAGAALAAPIDDIQKALQAKQFDTAVPQLRALAEKGDATAQFALATIYEGAFGYPKPDHKEALAWYRKTADQNVPEAQTVLADRLMQTQGPEADKSYAEAAKLYRAAADKLPVAASHMGDLYCYGVGVKEDAAECAKWYRKAAAGGVAHAASALGGMYAVGNGVTKDDAEANKWLLQGANGGDVLGQYGIAQAHLKGAGVKQDYVEAFAWLTVAQANPGAAAFGADMQAAIREDIAEAVKHLSAAQKTQAEKLAGERLAKK
ncbi:MAG: sel1 repeat family protein [Rhodospirillaceae bacterium]|nr:sel1 repeat family protein [Rhodospirillaceae bacterium]